MFLSLGTWFSVWPLANNRRRLAVSHRLLLATHRLLLHQMPCYKRIPFLVRQVVVGSVSFLAHCCYHTFITTDCQGFSRIL